MTHSFKMPAIKPPGLFSRLRAWLRRFFRKPSPAKLLDEVTVPVAPPVVVPRDVAQDVLAGMAAARARFAQDQAHLSSPVVARRVVMGENPLLAPVKPRLKPSMVTTTKLPSTEKKEAQETTKVTTPPEPISLPLPIAVASPKGQSRISAIQELPTIESPMEVVSRDAATQQIHAPHLLNPTTGSKIIPPTLRNSSNVIVPIRSMIPLLPEDMAPKTLVQPRVQDDPELMELVDEFNAKHGDSEP